MKKLSDFILLAIISLVMLVSCEKEKNCYVSCKMEAVEVEVRHPRTVTAPDGHGGSYEMVIGYDTYTEIEYKPVYDLSHCNPGDNIIMGNLPDNSTDNNETYYGDSGSK